MNKSYLDRLNSEADTAFTSGDFERAFECSQILAEQNFASAMFTCGLILENGWIDGVADLERANKYYRDLAIHFNSDEGYLGCARVILGRREIESRDQALKFCDGATRGRSKHLAFLLMGRIYEELEDPPQYQLARKFYRKSFCSGSAWALRQYARSLMRSRNYIAGVSMHIIATIVSPALIALGGLRKARDG